MRAEREIAAGQLSLHQSASRHVNHEASCQIFKKFNSLVSLRKKKQIQSAVFAGRINDGDLMAPLPESKEFPNKQSIKYISLSTLYIQHTFILEALALMEAQVIEDEKLGLNDSSNSEIVYLSGRWSMRFE